MLSELRFGSQKLDFLEGLLASELGLDLFVVHSVQRESSSGVDHGRVVLLLDRGVQELLRQFLELPLNNDAVGDHPLRF